MQFVPRRLGAGMNSCILLGDTVSLTGQHANMLNVDLIVVLFSGQLSVGLPHIFDSYIFLCNKYFSSCDGNYRHIDGGDVEGAFSNFYLFFKAKSLTLSKQMS